jgi:uncharacterized SAM-binding protein YcdF (DUF218 family)
VNHGIKNNNIIHIDETKISNTMEELFEIKKHIINNKLNSVLFVSHPTHSRRIEILANTFANYKESNIDISFASADYTKSWDKNFYFLHYESTKLVFLEAIKIIYNYIKYSIIL